MPGTQGPKTVKGARSDPDYYRIRGTSHGPVSVCVHLSQVGVLLERLNESGWFLACELPFTRPTLC